METAWQLSRTERLIALLLLLLRLLLFLPHPRPLGHRAHPPPRTRTSLRVVKDYPKRIARSPRDRADAVAHGGAMPAAGAPHGAMTGGEDHQLALLGVDRLAARLCPRALLDEQEIAALVVLAATAQEDGDLERERDVAVEVLVQAVVAAGLVMQEERGGLGLAVTTAQREQAREVFGIARARAQLPLPRVGQRGQPGIGLAP